MMRAWPAPSTRAACTYSSSRIESVCARTILPTEAQLKNAITLT